MQTPNQFELFLSLHTLRMKNYYNLVFKKIKQIHFKARFSFHFSFPSFRTSLYFAINKNDFFNKP